MCIMYSGTAHFKHSDSNNCYRNLLSEADLGAPREIPLELPGCYWSFAVYYYWSSNSTIGGTVGVPIV